MSMQCSVTIQSLKKTLKKDSSVEECNIFLDNCKKGNAFIHPLLATVIPVRTYNAKVFVKDFLFPTTVNQAWKVNNLVLRIFIVIFSLPLDGLTLPLRCITFIPRIYLNPKKEDHPLYRQLTDISKGSSIPETKDILNALLECDSLKVSILMITNTQEKISSNGKRTSNNESEYEVDQHTQQEKFTVNFIQLPY